MIDNVNVRRLTKSDVNYFFSLRLESLQNFPTSFLSSYEEEKITGKAFYENLLKLDNVNNVIFGAFFKEQLIGIVGISQETALKANHKSKIWGMYVQDNYRNEGVGKLLMKISITHARERLKSLAIHTSVETSNALAIKLYQSFGFKVWGTELNVMKVEGKFFDEFHMSLELN